MELVTASADETRSLAARVAPLLRPGDVVSLTGDLGAGKTTFVQGAAAGLGVGEPVVSPTFTLVREYAGRTPVFHIDVYRLDSLGEVLDLGFEEYLDRGGLVFVEWGDVIDALLPEAYLEVELVLPGEGEERRISLSPRGESWLDRSKDLAAAVVPWKRG